MPSLFKTLKSNTGLAQTSLEEAQNLTGQQAPTSPAQAASIGAGPDAAKMSGASAQKTSALRTAIRGSDDLANAQAHQQTRSTATAEEQSRLGKAETAEGLGGLQDRVGQLAKQKLGAGVAAGAAAVNTKYTTQQTADLAKELGRTPTAGDLQAKYGTGAATAGDLAAGKTQDTLATAELPPETQTEAQALLGEAYNPNMTVEDLQKSIQAEIDKEYKQTNQLQTQMADPYLGPAERAAARQQLREAGATGITAAESDMDKLADKIQQADVVKFNGQDMDVSTLLSDDYVTGLVMNYLQDPNSEASKNLLKNEPELMKFVKQFEPVLAEAAKNMDQALGQYADIRNKNEALGKADLGNGQQAKIPDHMMKAIFGEKWGDPGNADLLNGQASGFLGVMSNPSIAAPQKQQLVDMVTSHPDFAPYLASLSAAQLQNFVSGPQWTEIQTKMGQMDAVSKLDPNSPNQDAVASVYGFPNKSDMERHIGDGLAIARANGGSKGEQEYRNKLAAAGIEVRGDKLDYAATINVMKGKTPGDAQNLFNPGVKALASVVNDTIKPVVNNEKPEDKQARETAQDLKKALNPPINPKTGKPDPAAPITRTAYQALEGTLFPADKYNLKTVSDFLKTETYKTMPDSIKTALNKDMISYVDRDIDTAVSKSIPGIGSFDNLYASLTGPTKDSNLGNTYQKSKHLMASLASDAASAPEPAKTHLLRTRNTLQKALDNYKNKVSWNGMAEIQNNTLRDDLGRELGTKPKAKPAEAAPEVTSFDFTR